MQQLNVEATKASHAFCAFNPEKGCYTGYIPKKTQNKKDVMAAHRRSQKKTERQQAKQEIYEEISNS